LKLSRRTWHRAGGERVEDPAEIGNALKRALASGQPYEVEVICSLERPWSNMHMTRWWDVTVPANRGEYRERYERKRGF
jgi:acetolactate synthase-1/2/3 large subunit